MEKWELNRKGYPLTLSTPIVVQFRDGTTSDRGTVGDWHGCGGDGSNWVPMGDETDIVAYAEIVRE